MKKIRIHRKDSLFLKFSTFRIFVDGEFAGELKNDSSISVYADTDADNLTVRAELPGGASQELKVDTTMENVDIELNADGYAGRLIPIFVCLIPLFAILLSNISSARILATLLVIVSTLFSVFIVVRLKDQWISLRLSEVR